MKICATCFMSQIYTKSKIQLQRIGKLCIGTYPVPSQFGVYHVSAAQIRIPTISLAISQTLSSDGHVKIKRPTIAEALAAGVDQTGIEPA